MHLGYQFENADLAPLFIVIVLEFRLGFFLLIKLITAIAHETAQVLHHGPFFEGVAVWQIFFSDHVPFRQELSCFGIRRGADVLLVFVTVALLKSLLSIPGRPVPNCNGCMAEDCRRCQTVES